jgi:DNA-directed RNA polymerase specialized sigma24 family protein
MYTPRWQRHVANKDAEMHRLYLKDGLSRMRIAKIFDCRLREVNEALSRHRRSLIARSAKGGKVKPVTLAKVACLEGRPA